MTEPQRPPDKRTVTDDWQTCTRRTVEEWYAEGCTVEITEPIPGEEILAKMDELSGGRWGG